MDSRSNWPEQVMDSRPNWTDLPPEILLLIARKLTDIYDYIRFRSVSASWRRAAGPADLPSQLPWLIAPTLKDGCQLTKDGITTISFFDPHGQPTYCSRPVELPETQGKWIYGSSHGWLLMIGSSSPSSETSPVSLFNPLTGALILLPSLGLIDSNNQLRKVPLCSHPTSIPSRQLLVAIWAGNKLAFYAQGDGGWTIVNCCSSASDVLYFGDKIYFADRRGRLSLLQPESLTVSPLIHPRPLEVELCLSVHLVEAAGDFLLVVRHITKVDRTKMKIAIFKLDKSQDGELNWVNIGNFPLGLVCRGSMGWTGSVCALPLPDCKGYQIYFRDAIEIISRMIATI